MTAARPGWHPRARLFATSPVLLQNNRSRRRKDLSISSVEHKLYVEVIEHLNLTGQPVAGEIDDSDEQPAQYFPATWDDIAVGHLVIAHESAFDGWWEAIVLARDGDMLTLKWRDYPRQQNVVRHAATVALLKPAPISA